MNPLFITGIGTGIGKTLVAAILTEALKADYWKPVQAGFDDGTDSLLLRSLVSNPHSLIYPETYKLKLAASPHIAAREENMRIEISRILQDFRNMDRPDRPLIVEGAGGLLVPLNDTDFVIDLVKELGARVILVSRNYLGSINHSLMTAALCRSAGLDVAGWIFNDQYLHYEQEIADWSGYPVICSMPKMDIISPETVAKAAAAIPPDGKSYLYSA